MNISTHPSVTRHGQAGLTVLELVIAMALGIALMAGISQVFVGMRQTDRTLEVSSRMQESGRFALNFLAQDLRTAGYLGCASTKEANELNVILSAPPASLQLTTGVQGWEALGTGYGVVNDSQANVAVTSAATGNANWVTSGGNILNATNVVPDSDIIRVWNADPRNQAGILGVTQGITPTVTVSNMTVTAGDIMVLSTCEFIDVVQACSVTDNAGPPLTHTLSLGDACSPGNVASSNITAAAGGAVNTLNGTLYYVGKRGNVATNPPSLFRRTLGANGLPGTPEELVEGVESMQILYGENSNNDSRNTADRFVPANLVNNWRAVVSVRISLLIQSVDDNIAPSPQPYDFHGVTYDGTSGNGSLPGDNRLRRVFTTTINLRNRTL